ncbi:hypothetical protein PR202_ga13101 [Eleusine coracana subsp. coracana]|uniref:Uncharacterized protein n=1 Tax=Eleusine coracana subsp. coracana TaxID=191504 RepID=A0AAV5CDW1_ELECO|nr:hypothetical protein PR202_ga13101 [Eleusine coracana subsp. coracana]
MEKIVARTSRASGSTVQVSSWPTTVRRLLAPRKKTKTGQELPQSGARVVVHVCRSRHPSPARAAGSLTSRPASPYTQTLLFSKQNIPPAPSSSPPGNGRRLPPRGHPPPLLPRAPLPLPPRRGLRPPRRLPVLRAHHRLPPLTTAKEEENPTKLSHALPPPRSAAPSSTRSQRSSGRPSRSLLAGARCSPPRRRVRTRGAGGLGVDASAVRLLLALLGALGRRRRRTGTRPPRRGPARTPPRHTSRPPHSSPSAPAVGIGFGGSGILFTLIGFAAFLYLAGFLTDSSGGWQRAHRDAEDHRPQAAGTQSISNGSILCVDVKRSMDDGEKRFNQLSIEERGKFDEETLVNVNSIKRNKTASQRSSGFSNEYIVITILVAAEGVHKLPVINSSNDLKAALQNLAAIPSNKILAVEVLWTPQNENDTLTERELLEDYPLLRPL